MICLTCGLVGFYERITNNHRRTLCYRHLLPLLLGFHRREIWRLTTRSRALQTMYNGPNSSHAHFPVWKPSPRSPAPGLLGPCSRHSLVPSGFAVAGDWVFVLLSGADFMIRRAASPQSKSLASGAHRHQSVIRTRRGHRILFIVVIAWWTRLFPSSVG